MSLLKGLEEMYINAFHQGNEKTLAALCSLTIPRNLFLNRYKALQPLEELPEEQKREMKLYVHDLFPGRPVEFKLEAAKIIYTIGMLI